MDENNLNSPQQTPNGEEKPSPKTPTYVRILALIGALAMVALTIAYAYSIATGGIFWF